MSDNATSRVQTEVRVIRTSSWTEEEGSEEVCFARNGARRKEDGSIVVFPAVVVKRPVSVGALRFLAFKTTVNALILERNRSKKLQGQEAHRFTTKGPRARSLARTLIHLGL